MLVDIPRPRLLYGTVSGAIGAVLSLPPSYYHFLKRIEKALDATVAGVGGLSHGQFKEWQGPGGASSILSPEKSPGFVDGDLVERLLELPPETVAAVAAVMNADKGRPDTSLHKNGTASGPVTTEELLAVAEELSRLH